MITIHSSGGVQYCCIQISGTCLLEISEIVHTLRRVCLSANLLAIFLSSCDCLSASCYCLLCLLIDAPPCLPIAAALAGMQRLRAGALAYHWLCLTPLCFSFATGSQQHWGRRSQGAGNCPGAKPDTAASESQRFAPRPSSLACLASLPTCLLLL